MGKRVLAAIFVALTAWTPIEQARAESGAREVPFTQEDRDRMIRVETKIEEGFKSFQQQINDLRTTTQQQINDLKGQIGDLKGQNGEVKGQIAEVRGSLMNILLWGFGVTFTGMFALVGFVIWDRRTAVAPVQKRQMALEADQDAVKSALREYARKEPRLAEILKSLNLM